MEAGRLSASASRRPIRRPERLAQARQTPDPGIAIQVTREAPEEVRVNDMVQFVTYVTNTGPTPLEDVRVSNQFDEAVKPTDAEPGFEGAGYQFFWNLASLAPGSTVRYRVMTECIATADRACLTSTVTTPTGWQRSGTACVRIVNVENEVGLEPRGPQDPDVMHLRQGPSADAKDALRVEIRPWDRRWGTSAN